MASTSDGDEDKKRDLDTNDVKLSIDEGHFVDPTPDNASAQHHPPPKSPKGSTAPTEQRGKMHDPSPTAAARRQAYTKAGSNVSFGEDPLTEERHSKQTSADIVTLWVHVQCDCFLIALSRVLDGWVPSDLSALVMVCVCVCMCVLCVCLCVLCVCLCVCACVLYTKTGDVWWRM